MQKRPTSPGEILSEEFLKPLRLSQEDLALHLGCGCDEICRIIDGTGRVSPAMALQLSSVFGTSPDFWLHAQMAADMHKSFYA